MNRRRRTEIIIQGDPIRGIAKTLSEPICEKYTCKKIIEPRYGLTMVKVRESAKSSIFYIGEVLITEAKVEINQCVGIGIVMGMKKELAKQLAIVDATYKANLPETDSWDGLLIETEEFIREEKTKRQAQLEETKVQFKTMDL